MYGALGIFKGQPSTSKFILQSPTRLNPSTKQRKQLVFSKWSPVENTAATRQLSPLFLSRQFSPIMSLWVDKVRTNYSQRPASSKQPLAAPTQDSGRVTLSSRPFDASHITCKQRASPFNHFLTRLCPCLAPLHDR